MSSFSLSPLEIWDTLTTCYTGPNGLLYRDAAWLWEACETIASVNYALSSYYED